MLPNCDDLRRVAPDATLAYDSLRWLGPVGGEKEEDGLPELLMLRLLRGANRKRSSPIDCHFAGKVGSLLVLSLTSKVRYPYRSIAGYAELWERCRLMTGSPIVPYCVRYWRHVDRLARTNTRAIWLQQTS